MIFFITVAATLVLAFTNLDFLWDRFYEISERGGLQNYYRYKMFLRGIYMFIDNPIFGTGVGTYYEYRYTYESVSIGAFDDSHNLYAQILAENGIVGAIFFGAIIYYVAHYLRKIKNIDPILYRLGNTIALLFLINGLFIHHKYMFNFLIPLLIITTFVFTFDSGNRGNMISDKIF